MYGDSDYSFGLAPARHTLFQAELLSLPHDAEKISINCQPSGLRIWDVWIGLFDSKQIISLWES
jgi:hypothetical protein